MFKNAKHPFPYDNEIFETGDSNEELPLADYCRIYQSLSRNCRVAIGEINILYTVNLGGQQCCHVNLLQPESGRRLDSLVHIPHQLLRENVSGACAVLREVRHPRKSGEVGAEPAACLALAWVAFDETGVGRYERTGHHARLRLLLRHQRHQTDYVDEGVVIHPQEEAGLLAVGRRPFQHQSRACRSAEVVFREVALSAGENVVRENGSVNEGCLHARYTRIRCTVCFCV